MNKPGMITETDLHAYVDGELDAGQHRAVEAWLATHPEDAARVADYQRINNGLRELMEPALAEPGAAMPVRQRRWQPRPWQVAAVMAWVALGASIGWFVHNGLHEQELLDTRLSQNLVRPAALAHYVYSSEIAHPVEVPAAQEQHLVGWLSKRLDTPVRAPNLGTRGFQLVGGRLLPSTDRAAAQFMYQDGRGQRITLYARRGAWDNETTAFRFAHENGIGTFYWIDGPMGYALSGELEREQLLAIAETVYRQLNP
jgi:anti-sigma factor RsiW